MPSASQLLSFSALTALALTAWALAGRALHSRPDLDVPLNVLGINRSPYGEVIALAMQGPIDQTFQVGFIGSIGKRAPKTKEPLKAPTISRNLSLTRLLSNLERISYINTNPRPVSHQHRLHLRRNAEEKLRFAYHLDPSQYSNYNSLHFFLTEPAVGTRGTLTPAAYALARETIEYCLNKEHDPLPALTAAAACSNMLHLMFADRHAGNTTYSPEEMREVLSTLDQSIARYNELASQWNDSGNWNLLSPQRIQECLERYDFILKIRDAAETTISRFSTSQNQQELGK